VENERSFFWLLSNVGFHQTLHGLNTITLFVVLLVAVWALFALSALFKAGA
jgi:hypothetical protein